jgi:hypothetical protein
VPNALKLLTLLLLLNGCGLASLEARAADEDAGEPRLIVRELPAKFDRVRLLDGGRFALLVQGASGQGQLADLESLLRASESGETPGLAFVDAFALHHRVDDLAVEGQGLRAFVVGSPEEPEGTDEPLLWRLDLDPSATAGVKPTAISGQVKVPAAFRSIKGGLRLALTEDGWVTVAGVGRALVGRLSGNQPTATEPDFSFAEVPSAVAGLAAVPGGSPVFISGSEPRSVLLLEPKTLYSEVALAPPVARGPLHPFVLAVTDFTPAQGEKRLVAVVGDEDSRTVSLYDYNYSFGTLGFVTRADLDLGGGRGGVGPEPGLVLAASADSRLILVGSRQGAKVYFFAREQSVLRLLNVWAGGPVEDLDVSILGRRAVILTGGGTKLVVVDRPDLPVLSNRKGFDPTVKEAQTILSRLGYTLVIDGVAGESTKNGLQWFQRLRGLTPPKGKLDQNLLQALRKEDSNRAALKLAEIQDFFRRQKTLLPQGMLAQAQAASCNDESWIPPREKWCNAVKVAEILGDLSALSQTPISLVRVDLTRPSEPGCPARVGNEALPEFMAVDLKVEPGARAQVVAALQRMRDEGRFEGKIEDRTSSIRLELTPGSKFWVYLGARADDGGFKPLTFDLDRLPVAGDLLTPVRTTWLRASAPVRRGKKWVFGDRISLLDDERAFVVEDIRTLDYPEGEERYWASGRLVDSANRADFARNWVVVVAAFRQREIALAKASALDGTLPKHWKPQVFSNPQNIYQVVVGSDLDAETARRRVFEARCLGLGNDLYMWAAPDWTLVK